MNTKHTQEDHMGTQDEGTEQGKRRREARHEQVSDGEPQARSRAVATNGWRDHVAPKLIPTAEESCQNRVLYWGTPHFWVEDERLGPPQKANGNEQRKWDTVLPRSSPEGTTVESSHIAVTQRTVTPSKWRAMPKHCPQSEKMDVEQHLKLRIHRGHENDRGGVRSNLT